MSEMIIEDKKYSPEEVFSMLGKENLLRQEDNFKRRTEIIVDGFRVYPISLRYMVFYQKGLTCVCCGKVGTHFKLCGESDSDRRHFNLYADDGTLMTKDHIVPKSKKGKDHIDNLQTMCMHCNFQKKNTYNGK